MFEFLLKKLAKNAFFHLPSALEEFLNRFLENLRRNLKGKRSGKLLPGPSNSHLAG
jgi:hypothetical protein